MTFTEPTAQAQSGPERDAAFGRWPERRPSACREVEEALSQAREAIGGLLSMQAISPVGAAFGATFGLLDAAESYRLVNMPLDTETLLGQIALGLGGRGVDPEELQTVERKAESYLRVYAREVAPAGPGASYRPSAAPDLTDLPELLGKSFWRRVRLRGPHQHGPHREHRWLGPTRRIVRDRLQDRLDELARWAAAPGRDPIVTAAYLYARILDLHPYTYANVAAAHLAGDLALRTLPGVSAARIGLGAILIERLPAHRQLMCSALDAPHTVEPWLVAYAGAVHDAASRTSHLLERHRDAYRAVRDRLHSRDGRAELGRRRVDPDRLAKLAARTPYLAITRLVGEGVAQRRTAARYLGTMVRLGLGTDVRYAPYRMVRISSLADVFARATHGRTTNSAIAGLAAAARHTPYVGVVDL